MSEPRIVSLLASGTEIVCALGLAEAIVGISHECDYPPHVLDRPRLSRPRFDPDGLDSGAIDRAVRAAMAEHGSVYTVDAQELERLAPTVILTQAVCEVCAVPTPGVRDLVRTLQLDAEIVSLDAHMLEDIFRTVLQVGAACGVPDRAAALAALLRGRVDRVSRAVAGRPRPRVLALEWLDPPFVPGHWVPEMIERAGGICIAGEAAERSSQRDWNQLENLDPDVLILMPCGYGIEASLTDADRVADELLRVAPRAIRAGAAWAVDGSACFNRSGPRVVEGIDVLGSLLNREVLGPTLPMAAARWMPDRPRTAL